MKSLRTRIDKLESRTAKPKNYSQWPAVVQFPKDATPEQRTAIEADVCGRRADGETVLLLEAEENSLAAVIDHLFPPPPGWIDSPGD